MAGQKAVAYNSRRFFRQVRASAEKQKPGFLGKRIRCYQENFKSRAIPERLGFTPEGVIWQAEWLYDHFEDDVVYGFLAPEWQGVGTTVK